MKTITAIAALTAGVALSVATATATLPSASPQDPLACVNMTGDRMPPATRPSPLDSVSFNLGGGEVMICYGRPSARGREIFGGLVPYDKLWRTGANEPTMIHTTVALDIAGIQVSPGSYSFYTVPGKTDWEIIVNRSITQWGHEGRYSEEVKAQEVGRAKVSSGSTSDFVETFTISALPAEGGSATIVLEWERTRVEVPVTEA